VNLLKLSVVVKPETRAAYNAGIDANLAAHREDAEAIGKTGRKKYVAANIFWRVF
jgi:hypothetical protein